MKLSPLTRIAAALSLTLGLASCGGDSNDSKVAFSLGVSDAPVDGAKQVVIAIDEIRLIPVVENDDSTVDSSRDTVVIDTFAAEDIVRVDLLEYTGSEQLTIISEDDNIDVALGAYKMELVVDSSQSWVTLDDNLQYALKVPSTRLKLGTFNVVLGAQETAAGPAYTVEFDLRQSLVQRGNDAAKNGFIVKPHGVRITGSSSSGHIAGAVDLDALITMSELSGVLPTCGSNMHSVYLYQGDQRGNEQNLIDNIDADDIDFITPQVGVMPSDPVAPFASTLITAVSDENNEVSYQYEFGFVPNGEGFAQDVDSNDAVYSVAFACNAAAEYSNDDPVQYDGLLIANPVGEVAVVNVVTGETVVQNFPIAIEQ